MKVTKKLLKVLGFIFLVCYCAIIIMEILTHQDFYQWDFRFCYSAAKSFVLGQNPYEAKYILGPYGPIGYFSYLYSPLTILFFKFFLPLHDSNAFFIFFCLNCILLAGIFIIWKNKFIEKAQFIYFLYFVCSLLTAR